MKEECKLCSVGWCASQGTTDFSINSLMRPAAPHPDQVEPRHEAVLLSAYLFKLGYYQPAGPLIKETGAEAERALARYHAPHYHAPHPPVLQQYGPYYPAELCYGRYYRPPGPYHIPPPQPDAQMVGVGSEPYPAQYYGSPPCYQHSPQRIPYVEYRGCPCPLNACPKNVLIGPATGRAPTGGGPADVTSPLAPPGAAFRAKARAGALDAAADTHGSGKDPPLEPEPPEPPTAADAPHPCPLPAIGGASPKREMYDVRENLRINADVPEPTEALGPTSPARGACAPQPPPSAPRRARLGKAMARRSLAGDDTGLLLTMPQATVVSHDADDDVLAVSPPVCAPIDLSSSDERSTPLVDVKKENEGRTYATSRKTETQALKEHNSTTALTDATDSSDAAKAVKRRYSKPKLEIEMKDVQLEDACKTNGIGEHVKLQKRRKVSGEHTHPPRIETITKEPKKKSAHTNKRSQKTSSGDKKAHKRKSDAIHTEPKAKKIIQDTAMNDDLRLTNKTAISDDDLCIKPKIKSAILLDNLIRKNSIDRPDAKVYTPDTKLNPAELFLSPNENVSQNCTKKTLNINNNIVENNVSVNGVQPKTIAAVSQLLGKKQAYKNACKIEKVDSKITHNLKSVLSTPTEDLNIKDALNQTPSLNVSVEDEKPKIKHIIEKCEQKDSVNEKCPAIDMLKSVKTTKSLKSKTLPNQPEPIPKLISTDDINESQTVIPALTNDCKINNSAKTCEKIVDNVMLIDKSPTKRSKLYIDKTNGEFKSKNVENLVKLLTSKKLATKSTELVESVDQKDVECNKEKDIEVITPKRCKLTGEKAIGESKAKNVEKVVKLLVSKKTVIKTDEASLVVEDACSSPIPSMRKSRRGRSGGRRMRRVPAPLTPPDLHLRAQPKWSNGWNWDGEHYISKVYQNNDTRLDRTARCWPRMTHSSGDRVVRGDCVLLRASLKPTNEAQPYVARIASLWEDPDNGEMMVSLVWYYRPEHTERGRQATDAPDEVFASRHRDANSVACIEDKCYVLTFNEYCRYKKRLKAAEEGFTIGPSIVPPLPASEINPALAPNDTKLPPSVSPELVLFCRKIYDFRSKKIHVPNK